MSGDTHPYLCAVSKPGRMVPNEPPPFVLSVPFVVPLPPYIPQRLRVSARDIFFNGLDTFLETIQGSSKGLITSIPS